MAYKDLLAALPEDFKITVGDKEIDRAALMAEIDNEFGTVNTRVTELTAREKQLAEERDAAIAAATLTRREDKKEAPVDTRQALLEAMKGLVNEGNEYDFSDPYSKQLLARVTKVIEDSTGKATSGLQSMIEQLNQGIMGTAAIALQQQMNSEFRQYKWPEGYDPKRAWAEALKAGYFDPQTKIPDIGRYNEFVMTPVRMKEAADKRYEEGLAAGRASALEEQRALRTNRGRLGLVPRPGGGPLGGGKKGSAKEPQTLAEAIDSIEITDADIAANSGLRAG